MRPRLVRACAAAAVTSSVLAFSTAVTGTATADPDPDPGSRTKAAAPTACAGVDPLPARRAARLAHDDSFHLDACGKGYYVEEAATARQRAAARPAAGRLFPNSQTFLLESRAGSQRTLYLDFNGATLTGTAWNDAVEIDPIVQPAYSIDGDPSTFSAAEHAEIQRTWQIVAEDFAPFDVNVTTKNPGAAAIDRTDESDLAFGTTAVITDGGPVWDHCDNACSGIAYLDVFATTFRHAYYQPALAFTDGMTPYAVDMGTTISHEVGHNLGLDHDGYNVPGGGHQDYYQGVDPWGALMGSPNSQAVTQWSSGEYPGADNKQDDFEIIARSAPRAPDEHGNNVPTATPLVPGPPVKGIIGTRRDVDAFSFTGSGPTTVTVAPSVYANLDVQLVVKNAGGTTVATVNPPVARVATERASGLGAVWTMDLGAGGTYRLYVDGIGSGAPSTAGKYSDYDSLGAYTIDLETTPAPLAVKVGAATEGVVNRAYAATPVVPSHGTAPYRFSATNLPAGLTISPTTGRITGRPTTVGTKAVAVTVTDATGALLTRTVSIPVLSATSLTTTSVALPRLTVGTSVSVTPFTAVGGTAPYTYSATGLPAGLVINAGTGRITGIPTTGATYAWTITIADSAGTTRTRKGTVGVAAAVPVVAIFGAGAPVGRIGEPYAAAAPVRGIEGVQPYTYSATGLPAGLSISPTTGAISGTPTTQQASNVTIKVTDAKGASDSLGVVIDVQAELFVIYYRHFVVGKVGQAYSDRPVYGSGGEPPYVYTATATTTPALPAGLSINAATGFVTGTPTEAGTFKPRITVTDQSGTYIFVTVTLTIDP
ncbi:putative Ig domain-containing protein [Nocardioides stalactiti]|uniref:putative Ig domain-containing protein n=1 Tax=Nocardioides stalactiti TaxID=2755356 RepID=UPI0016044900|nr:putative Ig domain-containing protein [Nocardioides stalactiti]